jgi:NSS family neurotransmitter:Na+ symporter
VQEREKLASRLGFILLAAGCAIGLGNVWRFPFLAGQNGGGAFVLIYIVFVVILGVPVMVAEFAVGRGSQRSIALGFNVLEPKGTKWHLFRWLGMAGNYLLMLFYTTVAGWMLFYFYKSVTGQLANLSAEEVGATFGAMLGSPLACIGWMVAMCAIGFLICIIGLQKGVERITKIMMTALFFILIIVAIRAVTLPGAGEGLAFYLVPDFSKVTWATVSAAMGQAFFSLSLGMGSMHIFGSYLDKKRSLTGEAINVSILDTSVALLSGLVIFPACYAFGVTPDAGPSLIFITLPPVFDQMPLGQLWGSLFFLFMTFAALSTVIAVFENLVAFGMDLANWSRAKAVGINMVAVTLLSIPCALGFNLWSGFVPFAPGSGVLDLEDFIVSNNILPIGAAIYVLFCSVKLGWGWKNFTAEADAGVGVKFPQWARAYVQYLLPLIIVIVMIMGYVNFNFG